MHSAVKGGNTILATANLESLAGPAAVCHICELRYGLGRNHESCEQVVRPH